MAETALVTGASGFVGGHTVRALMRDGWDVVASGRAADALPAGVRTFVGDLDQLSTARIPVDVVIHCAARSSPWGRWRDFEQSNVVGTSRVLEFARRNSARRIVFVSSPSVYACAHDRLGILEHEVAQRRPLNGYIRSKLAAEKLLLRARDRPEVVIVRPRGIIGAGDQTLVPRLLAVHDRFGIPLFHGGDNLIDLTSVENVALALRLAAVVQGIDGEVFNITNGDARPFRALAEQLLSELGIAPRFRRMNAATVYGLAAALEGVYGVLPGRPEPPLTRYVLTTIAYSQTLDIMAARRLLGYQPETSIDSSLAGYADG